MTDEEIVREGSELSNKVVMFICDQIRAIDFAHTGDRDGVILCAVIRVTVSKIIHRSENKIEADKTFESFLKALKESYEAISISDFDRSVH